MREVFTHVTFYLIGQERDKTWIENKLWLDTHPFVIHVMRSFSDLTIDAVNVPAEWLGESLKG